MWCRRPLSIHNNYVVSQLDKNFINEVEDVITVTPAQNPYTILKTELIKCLSVSEEQRIRQLLSEEEWGERKPLLLRHRTSSCASYVQAILWTQPDTVSFDSPANTADTIMEVHHPFSTHYCETWGTVLQSNRTEEYSFSELSFKEPNPDYLVSFLARHRSPSDQTLCCYHKHFASKATKCTQPCSFKPSNSDSRLRRLLTVTRGAVAYK